MYNKKQLGEIYMKKYLGIIKIYEDHMSGTNIKILTKTYDDINLLNLWIKIYPNSEHIILKNTEELNSMFEIFKDMTPITDEEKSEMKEAQILYKKLMKD